MVDVTKPALDVLMVAPSTSVPSFRGALSPWELAPDRNARRHC